MPLNLRFSAKELGTPEENEQLTGPSDKVDGSRDVEILLRTLGAGEGPGRTLGGNYQSDAALDPKYRFQDIGAAPVSCRASVVRITFMKLLGIGMVSAYFGQASWISRDAAISCAFAAGVNLVACVHYWFIWGIRAQSWSDGVYSKFMVKIGYKGLMDLQSYDLQQKLFAQETAVDSLRHTDWTCTLVLMMLDLHLIASKASEGEGREALFDGNVAAFFQTWIILFGSFGRFFFNEIRPDRFGNRPKGWSRFLCASFMYVAATVMFVLCVYNLLHITGLPWEESDPFKNRDKSMVWIIMLVQLGYPCVTFVSLIWVNSVSSPIQNKEGELVPMPGNMYPPWLSTFKDVAYSTLDVTSKGGLAFYSVLRATWLMDAAEAE